MALAGLLFIETRQQSCRLQITSQGEAPVGELLRAVSQAQMPDTGVVAEYKLPIRLNLQAVPGLFDAGSAPDQTAARQNQQATREIQSGIEVNLQPG